MAPKGERPNQPRWVPKATPPASWLLHTAGRLERRAQEQPLPERALGGPSTAHAAAQRLARSMAQRLESSQAPASSSEGPEQEEIDATTLMVSQREYYRSGEGLLPTTFEPQRHTYFVCGRPVQVLAAHACRCSVVVADVHVSQ